MKKANLELMQIGDLSKKVGVSHRTIHYYEGLGLISPTEREGSGYRYYDESAVKRLEKIAVLKRAGLNLDEVASVLDLYFEDATGLKGKQQVMEILKVHLAGIDERLAEFSALKLEIEATMHRLQGYIDTARKHPVEK